MFAELGATGTGPRRVRGAQEAAVGLNQHRLRPMKQMVHVTG